MAGDYSLAGLAVPESLNLLQDLLAQVGRDHPGLGTEDLSMFETAIVEIHGNVIEHGRPRGKVVYQFELQVQDDRLIGDLCDAGEPVPDLSELVAADEMDEAGRGLWLARATLDELHYSRSDGHNNWRLVRLRR